MGQAFSQKHQWILMRVKRSVTAASINAIYRTALLVEQPDTSVGRVRAGNTLTVG